MEIITGTASLYNNTTKFGPRQGIVAVARKGDTVTKVSTWLRADATRFGGSATTIALDAFSATRVDALTGNDAYTGLNLARAYELEDSGEVVVERGWLAHVTGKCEKYRYAREFVQADEKRSRSRKAFFTAHLNEGLYEADSALNSMRTGRSYFRVAQGTVELLTPREFREAVETIA